jgi:TM2 domain-containing membrane protein YozV
VPNQTIEKQVEFYVIKDSTAVSNLSTVQYTSDSIIIFAKTEPQIVSDSLFEILINPLAFPEKPSGYRYEAKPKAQYIQNWSILILILLFIVLATIRTTSEKYVAQLFQSFFNKGAAIRLFRDKVSNLMHVSFRLDSFFILVIGLLIFQALNHALEPSSDTTLMLFTLSVVSYLSYITLKYSLYRISGFIFDINSEIKEYLFYAKSGNRIMGLILFPITVSLFFFNGVSAEYLLITGGIIFVIVRIINILRSMKVIAQKVFSIYYMILYLCTLEILPLLIMWRILWRA